MRSDRLRAQIGVSGNEAARRASGQTFRKELPDTLRLVAEVLREPAFAAAGTRNARSGAGDRARSVAHRSAAGRRARSAPRRQPVSGRRSALRADPDEELAWAARR